jgi:hypothetical protein
VCIFIASNYDIPLVETIGKIFISMLITISVAIFVKSIINLHNGKIKLLSEKDKGVEAIIEFYRQK